jgi:RNA polymerase sigma-70 factor, ECF subfamily
MGTSDSLSVTDLLARARGDDPRERERLFALCRNYLGVLARAQVESWLRAKVDASDLVQQTLLEAHRDFPTFQGAHEGELLAWLRRILAHNLFNEARHFNAQQRNASREVSLEQVQQGLDHSSLTLGRCLADAGPSPSSMAARGEAAVRLAGTLTRLPADYQTVLVLRVLEGLSAEEVGERMGRTAGAVRMLQMRALAALREELEQGERRGSSPPS